MMKSLLFSIYVILLATPAIVISQHDQVVIHTNNVGLNINITCLCTTNEECDENKSTCTIYKKHSRCYTRWLVDRDQIEVYSGCMHNDEFFSMMMCNRNSSDNIIVCCSDRDYCNDLDGYSHSIRQQLLKNRSSISMAKPEKISMSRLIIVVSVVAGLLLLLIIGCLLFYTKSMRFHRTDHANREKAIFYGDMPSKNHCIQRLLSTFKCQRGIGSDRNGRIPSDQSLASLLDELSTSTTGPALPLLMQRTLARQINLDVLVGAGRYGSVYRGKWREDYVAVKIFQTNDERSFVREVDIYQTVCLRHENILGYIAADNMDAGTHTQLWLVTDYHENGSVYDYLMKHTINVPILIKMMLSIASGLCHLHMPIDSTNGKVALAHRDLKTKNILVKRDLTCCIADLGLAVKEVRSRSKPRKHTANGNNLQQENIVIDIQANNRVGTHRYMAPEVLEGELNDKSFESFKAADIYALGLVYWEMLRRCRLNPNENDADPYLLPYEDVLPSNPNIEQMREVVCVQKIRPSSSERWLNHSVLRPLVRLCEELWIDDPSCRLNSLNVKKQLKEMEALGHNLANTGPESQQQSTQNDGPWTA